MFPLKSCPKLSYRKIPPIGDKSSKSPVKGLNLKSDKSEYSPGPLPRLFIILNNLPSLSNINIFSDPYQIYKVSLHDKYIQ